MPQSSSQPPVSDEKDKSTSGKSSAVSLLEKQPAKTPESGGDAVSNLPGQLQQSIASFESSVRLVAENIRYGSWTKRLATIGGVAVVAFNPLTAGKVAETFGVEKLPKWYVTAFWGGLTGLAGMTIVAAAVTLPKKLKAEVGTDQNRAIRGLRSFEPKDADIFAKLQRQRDVRECYEAVTAPMFRFGVLMGESGCGKSSLLKAGLLPKLTEEGATHRGVYVKFGDRSPLDAIRTVLIQELGEAAVGEANTDLLAMVTQASQVAGKPLVLVFDQFEQFFVQYKRVEERADFVQALKAWYVSDVPVRVLVGIRDDLYGRLIEIQKALGYSLGSMDSFRLEKFSPSQATAVLREIARLEGLDFNESFMEELARNELAGMDDALISPVDVQVLAWMIVRQSEEELRAFNQQSFQRLGGFEGLLQRFLERMLALLMGKAQQLLALEILLALTDRERNVRAGMLQLDELQEKLKGKGLPAEIGETVDWLARGDVRLVTVEERETGKGYELAHERLIPALLQVAGQELSAADRANQLLNRRVNEWVGNGRSRRYLFNWQELKLLRQHRSSLVWGAQRQRKEELVSQSWGRVRRQGGLWSIPLFLVLGVWGYSLTTPGTMQSLRWQIVLMERWGGRISSKEIEIASNLDIVAEIKSKHFPNLWIQLFANETESIEGLDRLIEIASETQDTEVSKKLLSSIQTFAEQKNSQALRGILMARVAQSYAELGEEKKSKHSLAKALETLPYSFKHTGRLEEEAIISTISATATLRDPTEAKKILSRIVELSQSAQSSVFHKSQTLNKVALSYLKLGDNDAAQEILLQSLMTAQRIQNNSLKSSALQEIALSYSSIKDTEKSNEILSQALGLVQLNSIEYSRARANISFIDSLIKLKGEGNSHELLSKILQEAQLVEDENDKVLLLVKVAEGAACIKDKRQANNLLVQVSNSSKVLQRNSSRSYLNIAGNKYSSKTSLLISIAKSYITLEDAEKAHQNLVQAMKSTQDFSESEYIRSEALKEVIQATGGIQDRSKTQALLSQALAISHSIQSEYARLRVLSDIAQVYDTLGEHDTTRSMLFRSLTNVQSIQDKYEQFNALKETVQVVGNLKDSAETAAILSQSLKAAEAIEDEYYKSSALRAIAEAAGNLEDSVQAKEVLSQSLKAAEAIEGEGSKSWVLSAIAEAYIQLNDITSAKTVLKTASKLSNRCALGGPYAELGHFRKAYNFAQECDTDSKLSIFAKILTVHAEQISPELKQLRETEEKEQ